GRRTADRRGVRGICGHEDLWYPSTYHVALEILRDDDHKIRLAAPQRFLSLGNTRYRPPEVEIVRLLHPRDDRAHQGAVVPEFDERRQMSWIGVDRKAEQEQLNQRQSDHHPKGDAVPPHLDKFLVQDRSKPPQRERAHAATGASVAKLSRAPAIR